MSTSVLKNKSQLSAGMLEDTPKQVLREEDVKKQGVCCAVQNGLLWPELRMTRVEAEANAVLGSNSIS